MVSNKPFVLNILLQDAATTIPSISGRGFAQYSTFEEITKSYATKQGLMQAAHYWARRYQLDKPDGTKRLWRGGYYTNYVIDNVGNHYRTVMHAYQKNASSNFQSLSVDLTSIVSRSGLGEDVRGEAIKNASSSKVGA